MSVISPTCDLGYSHRVVSANSMFSGVPQSRDRVVGPDGRGGLAPAGGSPSGHRGLEGIVYRRGRSWSGRARPRSPSRLDRRPGRRAPRMLPPYCPALYKDSRLSHDALPGRRPLVRCRFSRYRCPLPGFEPSTLVECVVGPATSRCRLSCLPMKPSNGLGGSRGDVEDTLKRNVVGRHSQSVACGRRGVLSGSRVDYPTKRIGT